MGVAVWHGAGAEAAEDAFLPVLGHPPAVVDPDVDDTAAAGKPLGDDLAGAVIEDGAAEVRVVLVPHGQIPAEAGVGARGEGMEETADADFHGVSPEGAEGPGARWPEYRGGLAGGKGS